MHLTGRENLRVVAAARGPEVRSRIEPALARVGLAERADDRVESYSMGMRQRLGVARCLLADPLLLILDEPTNGLDPGGIQEFRQMIRAMVEQEGRTVFISSHLLDEVEKTCDAAAIVDRGQVVTQGPVAELAGGGARQRADPRRRRSRIVRCELLEAASWSPTVRRSDEGLRAVLAGRRRTAGRRRLNAALVAAGVGVMRLEPVRHSLEQRFLEITTRLDPSTGPSRRCRHERHDRTQMVGADFLKLRKRRGTLIWALVLALAPLLIYFIVSAAQHSSSPARTLCRRAACTATGRAADPGGVLRPAGGDPDRHRRRSRRRRRGRVPRPRRHGTLAVALFASRVPAALGLCWLVVRCRLRAPRSLGTYVVRRPGRRRPSAALISNGLGFSLLSTGVVCAVAVGFSSLTALAAGRARRADRLAAGRQPDPHQHRLARQRARARAAARRSTTSARSSLGRPRRPVSMAARRRADRVMLVWLLLFRALGAWRTRTMDA